MSGILVCFLLSLLAGGVCYLASSHLLFASAVFFLFFLSFVSFAFPKIKSMKRKRRVRKECYRFMNSFITTCSVTSSLSKAYEISSEGAEGEEKEAIASCECNDVEGRLHGLSGYYESNLFSIFLSIVSIYQERGGDILSLSSSLLEEATRNEEEMENREKLSKGKLLQYGTLWAMSLLIVAFLRFALSSFYQTLISSFAYLACLGVYFAFLLFSLLVYCRIYTGEKGRGQSGKRGSK